MNVPLHDADDLAKMSLKELAIHMQNLQFEIEIRKESLKQYNDQYDAVRMFHIPNKMEEEGIQNINFSGIGRIQLAGDMYASTPADKREAAQAWLISVGASDLIKPTVNGSSLKSFLKERMGNGEDIPEDIFKISPFTRASIVRS